MGSKTHIDGIDEETIKISSESLSSEKEHKQTAATKAMITLLDYLILNQYRF